MTEEQLRIAISGFQAVLDRTGERRGAGASARAGIVANNRTNNRTDAPEHLSDARARRQARNSLELTRLLAERSDLRGVYAPADLVTEAMLWSA